MKTHRYLKRFNGKQIEGSLPRRSSLMMRIPSSFWLAVLISFYPYSNVRGEESETSSTEQTAIKIIARPEREGSTTTISSETFRGRFTALDEVLEKQASIRITRYGGLGSYSNISIRGSRASQVKVNLDGIPLNNAAYGEVNLSDLSLESVDTIEVRRNSLSAIGGEVNLTSAPDPEPGIRGYIEGGSEKTFGAGAEIRQGESRPWSVHARGRSSVQNYRFRNDAGTPVINTYDDFDDRRQNAQFHEYFLTGRYGFSIGNTDIRLLGDGARRKHGLPGPGANQTDKTERLHSRGTFGISSDSFFSDPAFFQSILLGNRIYYTGIQDEFFDPKQEFSFARPNAKSGIKSYGYHLEPVFDLSQYHQIISVRAGIERESFRRTLHDRFDNQLEREPTRFRNRSFIGLGNEIFFFHERLTIQPEIFYHRYRDRFNMDHNQTSILFLQAEENPVTELTDGSLSAGFEIWQDNNYGLRFDTGASASSRMPIFYELFGERGSIIPNTDLEPEKSEQIEGGFSGDFTWNDLYFEGGFTVFERNVRNMILLVPNSQFSLRAENLDRARITGTEMGLSITYKLLRFNLAYTYQEAINQSDVQYLRGNYLPLQPLHDAFAALILYYRNLETGLEYDYTGAVFKDRTNDFFNYEPARNIYNIYVKYKYGNTDFSFEVKNITDERIFDVIGYPLPGRTWYAKIHHSF